MVQAHIDLLLGPTASGKTHYIEELSKHNDFEVINCDSGQIYKYLDIGTAKPPASLLSEVPHHMVDVTEIDRSFSVGDFLDIALREIAAKKRIIISAGTPFYINILINGISDIPDIDPDARARTEALEEEKGLDYLYDMLYKADPARALDLSPNDSQRIKRSIEVYLQTGKPISYFYRNKRKFNIAFDSVKYLKWSRAQLQERIIKRTDSMIEQGLIEETRRITEKYSADILRNKKIIGYNEVLDYLEGNSDKDRMRELIISNTMKYVKSQLTFFRKIMSQLEQNPPNTN
ncbi:MAG: tRNA (adenosine(37)-N6)-dimethylallyltransferase MiaA [candidate division WOR-3 bacterium]|nr:tRNA (adenosine(37)-N6)-dimethylallyltransferase MiaA [candidate division WOR-3 bacterium]